MGTNKELTYTVTEEEYRAELANGLTDDEVLKPGTYKLHRNPWAEKLREAGKVKIRVYRGEDVVEEYWLKVGK